MYNNIFIVFEILLIIDKYDSKFNKTQYHIHLCAYATI